MPIIQIYVTPSDMEAARRIAARMFPEKPDLLDARYVAAVAAVIGMEKLRVIWNDAEDHDMITDGIPLKTGQ